MNANRKKDLAIIVEGLAAMFRTEVTKALLEGYWLGLSDLDYEEVKRAAVDAIRTCRFMPTVSELRERIHGSLAERAVIAWQEVSKAIECVGAYQTVVFEDPVSNAAVSNVGGWQRLCESSADELDRFIRRDFERAYQAIASHGGGSVAAHLGIVDRENSGNGYTSRPQVKVLTSLPQLPNQRRLSDARAGGTAGMLVDLAEKLSVQREEA